MYTGKCKTICVILSLLLCCECVAYAALSFDEQMISPATLSAYTKPETAFAKRSYWRCLKLAVLGCLLFVPATKNNAQNDALAISGAPLTEHSINGDGLQNTSSVTSLPLYSTVRDLGYTNSETAVLSAQLLKFFSRKIDMKHLQSPQHLGDDDDLKNIKKMLRDIESLNLPLRLLTSENIPLTIADKDLHLDRNDLADVLELFLMNAGNNTSVNDHIADVIYAIRHDDAVFNYFREMLCNVYTSLSYVLLRSAGYPVDVINMNGHTALLLSHGSYASILDITANSTSKPFVISDYFTRNGAYWHINASDYSDFFFSTFPIASSYRYSYIFFSRVPADLVRRNYLDLFSSVILDLHGDIENATTLSFAATRGDTTSAQLHRNASYMNTLAENHERALAACITANAIDSLIPQVHYSLGLLHETNNDIDNAIREFKKASMLIKQYPSRAVDDFLQRALFRDLVLETHQHLSDAYVRRNNPQEAIRALTYSQSIIPDDFQTQFRLAKLYLMRADITPSPENTDLLLAESEFKKCLRYGIHKGTIYYMLGLIYDQLDEPKKLEKYFSKATTEEPELETRVEKYIQYKAEKSAQSARALPSGSSPEVLYEKSA